MYFCLFFRFVNHVTEKGQNKAFALPVHKIALEVRIYILLSKTWWNFRSTSVLCARKLQIFSKNAKKNRQRPKKKCFVHKNNEQKKNNLPV